jgi:hypothetical protein
MKQNLAEKKWIKLRKLAEGDAEQWLAERKNEAKKIKAQTAEVMWAYAETLDPYGIGPHPLPRPCNKPVANISLEGPVAISGFGLGIYRKRLKERF